MNSLALLARDKFMPKMHLGNLDLHIVLADHLQKTKKEYKKEEIHDTFIKMN